MRGSGTADPHPRHPPFRQWAPGRLRPVWLSITGRLSPRLCCRLPPRQHELTEALSSSTIPAPRSTGGVTPDWRSRHAAQKGTGARPNDCGHVSVDHGRGGAHEKGARSGGQAPLRICACAGRGNPTLCRWPGGYERGIGHLQGQDIRSLPRRLGAPSRRNSWEGPGRAPSHPEGQ